MTNLEVIRERIEAAREVYVPGSALAHALAAVEIAVNEPERLRMGNAAIRDVVYGRVLVALRGDNETEGKAE